MNDNLDDTLKIKELPKLNELEYVQYKYDEALKKMLKEPTQENIDAFGEANCNLYETEDKYRIGARLVLQHSQEIHTL